MADAIEIAKLVVADRDGIYTELEDMFAKIILAQQAVVEAAKRQAERRESYDYEHDKMRGAVAATNAAVRAMRETNQ